MMVLVLGVGACSGVDAPALTVGVPPGDGEAIAATTTTASLSPQTTPPTPSQPSSTAPVPSSAPARPSTTTGPMSTTDPDPGDPVPGALPPLRKLRYQEVVTVDYPIHAESVPGGEVLAVASKEGRVWILDGGNLQSDPWLDITDRVRNRGEQGLLGMAFSPDYPDSGRVFVHYTAHNGDTVLAEYRSEGSRVTPESETILWRTQQPAPNHNGGTIMFGPDGYLYVGLGDGGGAADRFGHGQNPDTPLGALLRFDASQPGQLVPAPGNPFPTPEAWAIGLRNPWRFTIDHPTGLIVIADVGQNLFEEVSVAPVATPGLNYGWPITEGRHCFEPPSGCDPVGLTLPVVEIDHGDGGSCSITGGVVYRGVEIPELTGHYLFSDYCGGYLRSFPVDDPTPEVSDWTDQVGNAGQVVSFGSDADGEVYVLAASGSVLRLIAER